MIKSKPLRRAAQGLAILAVGALSADFWQLQAQAQAPAPTGQSTPAKQSPFVPPDDSQIPNDDFGAQVRLGREIFNGASPMAAPFVGNALRCANCHMDAGRLANTAPMWGAYLLYPQFRAKNGHVNNFQERLQGCFMYSMNGKAPPYGHPVLTALEAYAFFLAKGAPVGVKLPGQGYPRLPAPKDGMDYARGKAVYDTNCAVCHGAKGEGQYAGGKAVFPPLWGAKSYNWGAGMSDIHNAASFIKVAMPLSQGGKLSDQEAWDVAAYIDSQPRPQDPRYNGSIAATRAAFHTNEDSYYGRVINGVQLGAGPVLRR